MIYDYAISVLNRNNEFEYLDITDSEVITMDFEIKEIGEIANNTGWISNSFKIPATEKNKRLFGDPENVDTGFNAAWKNIDCRLYVNGIEITAGAAKFQIRTTEKQRGAYWYNCVIYSGINSFADTLRNKSLRDLSPDAYGLRPFTYSPSGVREMYNDTSFLVDNNRPTALLPVMDWSGFEDGSSFIADGNASTDDDAFEPAEIDITGLQPFVYFKNVINAICDGYNGFTFRSDVLGNPKYENIAFNIKTSNYELPEHEKDFFRASYRTNSPHPVLSRQVNWGWDVGNPTINGFSILSGSTYYLLYNQILYEGNYYFDIEIDGPKPRKAGIRLRLLKYTGAFPIPFEIVKNFDITEMPYVRRNEIFRFKPGEQYCWDMYGINNNNQTWNEVKISCVEFKFRGRPPFGAQFPIVSNLPDITQWDLFKEFLTLFGLFCQVDYINKKVEAYTFEYIRNQRFDENGKPQKDWTDKLDIRTEKSEFDLGYNQENVIKYSDYDYEDDYGKSQTLTDEGFFEVGYYDNFLIQNKESFLRQQTLPSDLKTIYEFKASTYEVREQTFNLADIARYRWISSDEIPDECPLTYVYIRRAVSNNTINIKAAAEYTVPETTGTFIFASPHELHAQDLVNEFYKYFIEKILRRPRRLTVNMNLDSTDLSNFNHFIPIYLKQYGKFFFIEKIDKFRPGQLTAVNLIKLE